MEWTVLIRWIHEMSIVGWLGGLFFLLIILLPVARQGKTLPDATFVAALKRFNLWTWIFMFVVAGTGLTNLWGEVRLDHFLAVRPLLTLKIDIACLMLFLGILNALFVVPKVEQEWFIASELDTPEAQSVFQRYFRLYLIASSLIVLMGMAILMMLTAAQGF